MSRPQLWVFAGPNGAGKSTLVRRYWVAARIPVVNPDDIARSIKPGHRGEAAIMFLAGKEAAKLRQEHLASARSFAIETTLSGHSELRVMEDARAAGFKVNLIFLGIAGPETSFARVRGRVRDGGHDVPVVDIRRRYARTMENLQTAFQLAHRSFVLDNQGKYRPRLLFVLDEGRPRRVARVLPGWAQRAFGSLGDAQGLI
ncbi:AAA family ATPase [Telmatospirillum siberiense]|uniref:Zeta toxin family protein n=1 Tax=Telmatospirillum siberiense TaxID=382514 RepID=A0A2N3Q0D3_9PROT|nr:AAA family ATPase [Telmatospirillum siberiense]PKU26081.1 zeta toxin family protein [Telmatospirillum siberiense]